MPPKVKFPLDMGNDVLVRNIDELKENFNAEKVTEYFLNGKLLIWLNDRYYDEEAEQVEVLSSETDKSLLAEKLCGIFGIETDSKIDVEALERRRERLEKLRSVTSDDEILSNVDYVAFSQEELGDLLDEEAEVIYLCGKNFRIPLSVRNKKYIGINAPIVDISTKEDKIDLKKYGIVIEKCSFSEKTQAKIKDTCEGVVEVERGYVEADYDDISEIIYDIEDEEYDEKEAFESDIRPYKKLNDEKVTGITIPDGVTKIGNCAFRGFKHLKTIKIPDSVTTIGSWAFDYCENLEEIVIPPSVTVIEEGAFRNCKMIKSIVISDNVTEIEESVFECCSSLSEINIPDNVTEIKERAFRCCSSLERVDIPSGVTVIRDYVFSRCNSLSEINIPYSVTEIGEYAFEGCNSLSEINFPDGLTKIGEYAFGNCSSLSEINFPDGLIEIGANAFECCRGLKRIDIPSGVAMINDNTFSECSSLSDVNFADGLTEIESWAFNECEKLSSIYIPDSVVKINMFAFLDCKELTNVRLSNKLEEVDFRCFQGWLKLHSLEIPDGVKEIAVDNSVPITSLTVPESVPFNSFLYNPSADDPIRELNLPLSYKKDFSFWEKDLPSDCKLSYYSKISNNNSSDVSRHADFIDEMIKFSSMLAGFDHLK